MSQRFISRLLIVFGAMCLVYGFFMDTTVPCGDYSEDRCLNMFKQAQQTRYLIAGGIVLLAGILLFGFRRLKQTADDEKRERELDETRKREGEQQVKKVVENTVETTRQAVDTSLRRLRAFFVSDTSDRELRARFITGVVVGGWLVGGFAILTGIKVWLDIMYSIAFFGCVVYSLRAVPTVTVKRHLWSLCAAVTLLYFAIALREVLTMRSELANEWTPDRFQYANFVDMVIAAERVFVVFAVALAISAIALFLTIRADRRERDYH